MAMLRFESTVPQPIAQVWREFQDVRKLLPALSPPKRQVMIDRVEPEPPQLGTLVFLSMRGPIGKMIWVAKYTDFRPPYQTITGTEARFVDVQLQGPFERWTQSHEFEAIDDRTTRCIDVIHYKIPLGIVGRVADWIAVRWIVRRMFAHRHKRMAELFGRG